MKYLLVTLIVFLYSCKKETVNSARSSTRFSECNEIVSERCTNFTGKYCLFGFKWGQNSTFPTFGINAKGPMESGGLITYSFHEENRFIATHKQINVNSLSFNRLESCAKVEIRKAIDSWSAVADINFEEQPNNSSTNLKFFVAEINTGGVGYPNYPTLPCSQLAGQVILHPNFTSDCNQLYLYALHEIGHALGLGHSSKNNIMGADLKTTNLEGLQIGDIAGIQAIYGEK